MNDDDDDGGDGSDAGDDCGVNYGIGLFYTHTFLHLFLGVTLLFLRTCVPTPSSISPSPGHPNMEWK